ncbi:hypothetical protein OKW46_001133 [Paraburkholderia sp. WSM4179]|nr:hypothetical protein [Paraburkholderia sp. WSM4179]
MCKPDLLVVHRYSNEDMAELAKHYTLPVLSDLPDSDPLIADVAQQIRAVATNGDAGDQHC